MLRGAGSPRSQPSPGLCWTQRCRDTGPEAHPALSGGELGGLPTHPSPSSHQGQCRPGGHSLDELPSKGFQLARRCCRCQQQVQALPRQHVTQDPQQALRGLGVIRIHGLQKNNKKKNRGKRSHGECVLQCSSKTPAVRAVDRLPELSREASVSRDPQGAGAVGTEPSVPQTARGTAQGESRSAPGQHDRQLNILSRSAATRQPE